MAAAKKRADNDSTGRVPKVPPPGLELPDGADHPDGVVEGEVSPEVSGFRVTKIPTRVYNAELYRLQGELGKLQSWVKATGARVVVIFEGRDAAGKGGTIKRITEYLSPRVVRIAALPAPTEREKGQWYFQRYVEHLPAAGEMVLFDRSWYNRAGVEKVMGFCTPEEHKRFLRQCPIFEQMLVEDGIFLRKYWFSVSDDVQFARFRKRLHDPLRQWKLSPIDLESITRWEDFSRAKDEMMVHTDTQVAPWHHVASDSKKQARLNMIHHLLSSLPYRDVEPEKVKLPERPAGTGYQRPPIEVSKYVPDWASSLVEDPSHK
ncbi:polyphosphate kinase 2 [Georgenia thermotolerans]|uniref:ADP/GDP-polyphosphate phosphotransferase n=1 Tax=Georgenia thermotolerans TaxID=527326 RepID=A0A7J5UL44_9MICO|nr:polyphosphate kinase 2 [Georgenia thermotolerans]KAE8763066.1 polyphosphate kinase 2 [Georgenia thermotolerans]